jgi:acetyl-CoA acetyltransferase
VRIDGVAVAGVGMIRFGKYPDRSCPALARDAALAALHDAGMSLADVDEAFVGYIQPASLLGIKAVKELGLTGLPVTHVENASATGLVAFREAAWAVASGRAEVALALAFDKMTDMARGSGSGRVPGETRSTRRSSPRPTSPCGPNGGCTITARNPSTSPPSPPRTGTTVRCARGAIADRTIA